MIWKEKVNLIVRRIISFVLDIFFIYFIYFSIGVILIQFQIFPDDIFILIKYLVIFILYHTFLETKYQQTIGMFLLKVKVVSDTGKLKPIMILIKNIILFIEQLLLFLPCLISLFHKDNKTLHDIICKTKVVKI